MVTVDAIETADNRQVKFGGKSNREFHIRVEIGFWWVYWTSGKLKNIAEKRIKALETRADEKDEEIEQLKKRVEELEESWQSVITHDCQDDCMPVFDGVEPNIILSNVLGAVFALLIAVGVSWVEYKRRERNEKQNWYRSIHNTLVRAYGAREINHRGLKNSKLKEYAQLYRAFSEQIENQLTDAPTEEIELPLFNALQNTELSLIRYANETETPNPHGIFLQSRHETMIDFCLIAMYIIEVQKQPDIEFLHKLEGDELEEAEEKFQKFSDGTLYEEENERVRQTMQELQKLG